ncbi:sensor histidine kinase [Pseudorhizobium endolithicum]|uniref:histidine kinase n=2 Tax=Pseudorhizobium endolithicum TaxID=1191678 RepID=A0ABM8PFW9_9HYPH|nr:HAMP domain-containing sensor histidine kinase [Pseudorhizobium endolithicum]CAD7027677.1 sensor histidine kinase [Pseudorhizobium endolithicum]
MRTIRNMAGKAVAEIDRAAARWLEGLGQPEENRARDVVRLRVLSIGALAAAAATPVALSPVLPLSLALPVGATGAAALFLSVVAVMSSMTRRPIARPPGISADSLVFDACPGLSLLLDPRGVVTRCGGRDRASFPAALQDACGQRLAELVHVSDRIALVHALDTLRQGADAASAAVRVQGVYSASQGRQFLHLGLEMTAMRGVDGELEAVFAQMRDVSAEEALRREATDRVSEARSAHEAKSRFLAAVSHELRTPLNAILGFSDVLAGEYFGRLETDRQKEYIGLIRQSGAHLLSLVNTMLDMSKIEAGRYQLIAEPFAVDEVVEACRAMLDLQARGKGVTLTARTAKGLGEVVADRRAVKQILINLAGNAVKFTEAGGIVTIDAVRSGSDLVLTVSDTGIGIPADKLEFLGQPFMQVQDDYTRGFEGTGLGLSLVKGLVALHGGRLHISSSAGEGTVVTVTLPADGSGIAAQGEDGEASPVEFPPRLPAAARSTMKDVQDRENDDAAQAKIA